ncbi:D-inositol-3-phosphate glycosyltransferase [Alphaproteobacteria bacterium SO-S41]|nr:D-inositol-3-phosphate glycosyltransferase [Alphaproteobacteria bacterium SO-S41]
MKLLIDGVFFQLAQSGIARIWQSVLPSLIADKRMEVLVLDRGGLPAIDGMTRVPFPAYKDRYTADDSILIQKICDLYKIDVFTTTYYTTPLTTPMFLMVYDMIPELFGFDLSARHWREKALAISYARSFISISENTRSDLLQFYPDAEDIAVAHLGYDRSVFKPLDKQAIEAFREKAGMGRRPYVLLVGSREQHLGYKNTRLLFEAIAATGRSDFDVLCIGGEETVHEDSLALLPPGVRAERVVVSDADLAAAYNGAVALVYPSLYEGFGLPVLEAMACGCPVITTSRGSLSEVAGNACIKIEGTSISEMVTSLGKVQISAEREKLRKAGIERAAKFDWSHIVSAIYAKTSALSELPSDEAYRQFASQWSTLRRMQAEVDIERWG